MRQNTHSIAIRAATLLSLLLVLLGSTRAMAQDIREERVRFSPGSSGAEIRDSLRGYETVDYLLGARAGQSMTVQLRSSNRFNFFNVLIGDDPSALFVGSSDGNRFEGVLPASADYRIRVYLMRNAARRNETADYELEVLIGGAAQGATQQRNPDYADGLSGGPDYWAVTNVPPNDTLNVRAGPGTGNRVVGALANDDLARNLGCEMVGNARWCQIEVEGEMRFTGWVNGHYLREASSDDSMPNREATGQIPCSPVPGQPTRNCNFRVSRGQGGTASVWVDIGGGVERYIAFRNGEPVTSEAGLDITYERSGDLYLIRVGGVERYEIPEAVIFGG